MIDLTLVQQGRVESIHDYFKRFKDIKNQSFNLLLSEKDLVDLALASLGSHFRENLDGMDHYSLNQLRVRALGQECRFRREKNTYKPDRSNTHVIERDSDSSDDKEKEVYTTEFVWPTMVKPYYCSISQADSKESAGRDEVYF